MPIKTYLDIEVEGAPRHHLCENKKCGCWFCVECQTTFSLGEGCDHCRALDECALCKMALDASAQPSEPCVHGFRLCGNCRMSYLPELACAVCGPALVRLGYSTLGLPLDQ